MAKPRFLDTNILLRYFTASDPEKAKRAKAKPYRELAEEVGVSPDLDDGHGVARAFLDPILRRSARGAMSWNAATLRWIGP